MRLRLAALLRRLANELNPPKIGRPRGSRTRKRSGPDAPPPLIAMTTEGHEESIFGRKFGEVMD